MTMLVSAINKRLSQNKLEMASVFSFQIEVIVIFLCKRVYEPIFEEFIFSNCIFRSYKLSKRQLLQDYVQ